MAKDKKKKRNKLKTFLSLAAIFIACFLIYAASSDLMMTMKLKDEITSSEEMINSLENQKDDLSKEKQNLENPEYVKRFARGKYMVSKPGEQVFKLPAFCIRTDIIATSIRKTDIQQQQIKRLLIQLLQCRTFMVAPHHLIAFLFQCIHKTHRNGLIILNKQQFHKHPLPFLFCIIKNKYHPVYVCDKTVTI